MATSTQILKDISDSKLKGIGATVKVFLKCTLGGRDVLEEKEPYINFVLKCLHTIVSKLKTLTDAQDIREVLDTARLCCEAYVCLQNPKAPDKTYAVPKLVYYIINNFRSKEYVGDIVRLSDLVYQILDKGTGYSLPEDSHAIINALFACLWNTTLKLMPQHNSGVSCVSTDVILGLQKCCLMFLSLLPDKEVLIDRFKVVLAQFAQVHKEVVTSQKSDAVKKAVSKRKDGNDSCASKICYEIICSIFESIMSRLSKYDNDVSLDGETLQCACCVIQLKSMFVEHLVKVSNLEKALTVAVSIKEESVGEGAGVPEIISNIYEASVMKSLSAGNHDYLDKLHKANEKANRVLEICKPEEIKLLYISYNYLLTAHQVDTNTNDNCKTVAVLQRLMKCCDMFLSIIAKKMANYCSDTNTEETGNDSNKVKSDKMAVDSIKKKVDEKKKLLVSQFSTRYMQLQIIRQLLKSTTGFAFGDTWRTLLTKCSLVASEFHAVLQQDHLELPDKLKHTHMYNCGYICSSLGKHCLHEAEYETAITLYTIAVFQLNKCQQPNLLRLFECMVECHLRQKNWMEATKVIITVYTTLPDSLAETMALWVKLKADAVSEQAIFFQSMTFLKVYKNSGVNVTEKQSRDILMAEYQAWKELSRRKYEVEYHVLCELCDCKQTDIQIAEAQLEMAKNLCITQKTYNDRSAGELLNQAIVTLDKSKTQSDGLLALAYYTKYVVTHEDTILELQRNHETQYRLDTDGENAEKSANDQSKENKKTKAYYTLQSEESYFPYLVRAIQLWEKCFGEEETTSEDEEKKVMKIGRGANKGDAKKQSNPVNLEESVMLDLTQHVDSLIQCGTMLVAMKKPLLAWRALKVAKSQLSNISDTRQAASLTTHTARVLMLLGRYDEAESLVATTKEDSKSRTSLALLHAELCLHMGKKEEGMKIVNKVLTAVKADTMTHTLRLVDGSAKRLLSMFLCFPEGHVIDSTNHYLLFLAFEAVQSHIAFLNFMANGKVIERKTDKWILVYELLQSLFHLCKLYILIGLPRCALCYLYEGLKISQSQGLPRWSCDFLFEMLRARSMEADYERALVTIDSINSILTVTNQSSQVDQSASCLIKKENQSKGNDVTALKKQPDTLDLPDIKQAERAESPDCFGFSQPDITPEKDAVVDKLDSEKKRKMLKLQVPDCICMNDKLWKCDDVVRHRLCMRAGIVLAEFLAQSDMRNVAERLLKEVETKFKLLTSKHIFKSNGSVSTESKLINGGVRKSNEEQLGYDPEMMSMWLEASCVQAEAYLHQNNYGKVHQIWAMLSEAEKCGYLKNVLHSNILMTRLALCDATCHILSMQNNSALHQTQSQTGSGNFESVNSINHRSSLDTVQNDCEVLTKSKKNVTFNDKNTIFVMEATAKKGAKRRLLKEKEPLPSTDKSLKVTETSSETVSPPTPLKTKADEGSETAMDTPDNKILFRIFSSSKKERLNHMLQTPLSSRKAALDFLMESDDEDDISFPEKKAVTPRPVKPEKMKITVSKTEQKNSRKQKNIPVSKLNNKDPVCKLEHILEDIDTNTEKLTFNDIDKNEGILIENMGMIGTESDTGSKKGLKSKLPLAVKKNIDDEEALTVTGKKVHQAKKPTVTIDKGKAKKFSVRNSKKIEVVEVSTTVDEESCVNVENEDPDQLDKRIPDKKILKETCLNRKKKLPKSNLELETENNSRPKDIFDFDMEASPEIKKSTKKATGRQVKKVAVKNVSRSLDKNVSKSENEPKRKTKQVQSSKANIGAKTNEKVYNLKQDDAVKLSKLLIKSRPTRGGRGKKSVANEIETARYSNLQCIDELNISYPEMESTDYDAVNVGKLKTEHDSSLNNFKLPEPIVFQYSCEPIKEIVIKYPTLENFTNNDLVELKLEDTCTNNHKQTEPKKVDTKPTNTAWAANFDYDQIEIMRGDTECKNSTKSKGSTRPSRRTKNENSVGKQEEKQCVDSEVDSSRDVNGLETVRSGSMASLKDITDKMNCAEDVTVSINVRENKTGAASCSIYDESVVSSLEFVYKQIRHFAPYPQHPDVCQRLALHYLHTNPQRAAFLLSDSMAVTFRHQIMMNVGTKVRRQQKRKDVHTQVTDSKKTAVEDEDDLTSVRDGVLFDKDESNIQDMISVIPADWCVVQLSVVHAGLPCPQFILTRFVKDQSPVAVQLPGFTSFQGNQILQTFSEIQKGSSGAFKITEKKDWWKLRYDLDSQLKDLIQNMESHWIGHWKGAFMQREFSGKVIEAAGKELKNVLKKELNQAHIEILLLSAKVLSSPDLQQCASELLGSQCNSSDLDTVITVIKKHSKSKVRQSDKHHMILILDKTVQHLPWECIPTLSNLSVSRMPCLSHLYTQLIYLQGQESSVFNKGVNPTNTYYILNPGGSLIKTEERLKQWFESEPGWEGVVGVKPTIEQFTEAITEWDRLIYCGHGSGGQFFRSDEIEKLQGHATIILMGCSSGKLLVKGQLEPTGMMLSYFLAGCPCMVANLWDVTDRDIDKYTVELIEMWTAESNYRYLPMAVQGARDACKLKYLVGAAPVVYGLPVFINKAPK